METRDEAGAVPLMVMVWPMVTEVGETDTVTAAAAITTGENRKIAASNPAAMAGSGFKEESPKEPLLWLSMMMTGRCWLYFGQMPEPCRFQALCKH